MKLHSAAKRGDVAAIERILAKGHIDLDQKDRYGWCAIHWAASLGQKDAVSKLVERGANPMMKTSGGNLASELASKNHLAIAQVLLTSPINGPSR